MNPNLSPKSPTPKAKKFSKSAERPVTPENTINASLSGSGSGSGVNKQSILSVRFADPEIEEIAVIASSSSQFRIPTGESLSEINIPKYLYEENEDQDQDRDQNPKTPSNEIQDTNEANESLTNESPAGESSESKIVNNSNNNFLGSMISCTSAAEEAVQLKDKITHFWEAIEHIVTDVPIDETDEERDETKSRRTSRLKPIQPSVFYDLEDKQISKILSYLPIESKQTARLVCLRWKAVVDSSLLRFQRILTRNSIKFLLQGWTTTPLDKLIVCDLLDVSIESLNQLSHILSAVKELQLESECPQDYDQKQKIENPTIGEANLVEILKMCHKLEKLDFNHTALGNFGLEVLKTAEASSSAVAVDENSNVWSMNEFVVGWKWTNANVKEGMSAVSAFLHKIIGDLDTNLLYGSKSDGQQLSGNLLPGLADPPTLLVKYQEEVQPPFPAFETMKSMDLFCLRTLSIKIHPTKMTEKMGLIAFLHVLKFPQLRSFSLFSEEYCPDEALYRTIIKFIAKHHYTLRHLSFINPILSARISPEPNLAHLTGLDKVVLKSIIVAWENPIGLDHFWADGHYLLRQQKRLRKLEFHTASTHAVELIVWNNFRFLTHVTIEVLDTMDRDFDCGCFVNCAKLRFLSLKIAFSVEMKNACKIPDTIEMLHWSARYSREDIRWFSRFFILAKCIYIYHDNEVPMDIMVPFTFTDFINFLQLPCLEQLYLPRIQLQDPRVTRFCSKGGEGLRQNRDFFRIDRKLFTFEDVVVL